MRKPIRFHPTVIIVAIIVLAIVVPLAWRSWFSAPPAEEGLVTFVDRGFEPEALENVQKRISVLNEKIEEAEAEGGDKPYDLILLLGNAYYSLGDLGTAVEIYDSILEDLPDDPAALENKAQAVLEMGDPEQAIRLWEASLVRNPTYEQTYFKVASAYQKHFPDKLDLAIDVLEQGVQNIGQTKGLMIALGNVYRDMGDYDAAISHYRIAVQLDPENEDLREELSALMKERNQKIEAERRANQE